MSLWKLVTMPFRAVGTALDVTGINDVAEVFTDEEDGRPRHGTSAASQPSVMDMTLEVSTDSNRHRLMAFAWLGVTCAAGNGRITYSQAHRGKSDMQYVVKLFEAAVDEEIERRKADTK